MKKLPKLVALLKKQLKKLKMRAERAKMKFKRLNCNSSFHRGG
jgi:hypothetical protein